MTDLSSHIFISHASNDKRALIRPLAEALCFLGMKLWLDRPGHSGRSNDRYFEFDEDFIARYGIESIRLGDDWDHQILKALRECGAVLACFSRNFFSGGKVPVQELLAGQLRGNLIACIVDDLSFDEIPPDIGLTDARKLQVLPLSPTALSEAIGHLRTGTNANSLPDQLRNHWETLRRLATQLEKAIKRPNGVTPTELTAARKVVAQIPIGPMVRMSEIPIEIVMLCADQLHEPARMRAQTEIAMRLVVECNKEEFNLSQIVVRPGEMLSPENNPPSEYWSALLSAAGRKSRRTLAALLIAPGGVAHSPLGVEEQRLLQEFVGWLKMPSVGIADKA